MLDLTLPSKAAPCARDDRRLTATTITTIAGAEMIATRWRRLEQNQKRAVFFQSFDWCLYVWRTRAASDPNAPAPHVLVVRDETHPDRQIVAIWPLAIRTSPMGRVAEDLTEPFGQYSDVLIDETTDDVLAAIWRVARQAIASWNVDALVVRKVRDDSVLAQWLADTAHGIGDPEVAPVIALDRAGGSSGWHKSLNSKTRKNLRNLRNRLAREGDIDHRVLDRTAERAAAIADCFRGRSDWLTASGLSSTAFADPAFADIVSGLAESRRQAPPVTALRLSLSPAAATHHATDGTAPRTVLSLHWGFEHCGTYYAYMAWKNAAFDAFSPGRIHLETIVGALHERGITRVDMLVPGIPYKLSVATDAIGVNGYGIAFSARGTMIVHGWYGIARPALKRAVLSVSPAVRKRLAEIARTAAQFARARSSVLRTRSRSAQPAHQTPA